MNAWKETSLIRLAMPSRRSIRDLRRGVRAILRGGRRDRRNLATMINEELTQTVAIVENGKRTKIPKIRAAIRQALNRAMAGDFKALQQIVIMLRSHDALKRVAITKPTTIHPKDYANLSAKEAAELYQRALSEDWED